VDEIEKPTTSLNESALLFPVGPSGIPVPDSTRRKRTTSRWIAEEDGRQSCLIVDAIDIACESTGRRDDRGCASGQEQDANHGVGPDECHNKSTIPSIVLENKSGDLFQTTELFSQPTAFLMTSFVHASASLSTSSVLDSTINFNISSLLDATPEQFVSAALIVTGVCMPSSFHDAIIVTASSPSVASFLSHGSFSFERTSYFSSSIEFVSTTTSSTLVPSTVTVVNDEDAEQKQGFGGTGAAIGGELGAFALLGLLLLFFLERKREKTEFPIPEDEGNQTQEFETTTLVEREDYISEYGVSDNVNLSDADEGFPTDFRHDTDLEMCNDDSNLASEHPPEEPDFVIEPEER
jgi:hypothetical protein